MQPYEVGALLVCTRIRRLTRIADAIAEQNSAIAATSTGRLAYVQSGARIDCLRERRSLPSAKVAQVKSEKLRQSLQMTRRKNAVTLNGLGYGWRWKLLRRLAWNATGGPIAGCGNVMAVTYECAVPAKETTCEKVSPMPEASNCKTPWGQHARSRASHEFPVV